MEDKRKKEEKDEGMKKGQRGYRGVRRRGKETVKREGKW
jgi:hypothetical protein